MVGTSKGARRAQVGGGEPRVAREGGSGSTPAAGQRDEATPMPPVWWNAGAAVELAAGQAE